MFPPPPRCLKKGNRHVGASCSCRARHVQRRGAGSGKEMDIETLPKKKVDVSDVSEVSPRDIYMRLCACRDFEIKLQWERAVFLTAFLIACFAGYGSFLLSVHQHGAGAGNFSSLVINGIFITLTFVGVVLSLLWILMAKGSKAWYEHYEQAIAAFAKTKATTEVPEYMLAHRWYDMKGILRNPMSSNVFSLKGGAYSVSKIVIAIGICSLMIWSALFVIHCVDTIFGSISKFFEPNQQWGKVLVVLLAVVALAVVIFLLIKKIRSGYLKIVESILPKANDLKLRKTTWNSKDGAVKDWIRTQKKGKYVLIEKDKITIYEHSETVTEKSVSLPSECVPGPGNECRLFFCE